MAERIEVQPLPKEKPISERRQYARVCFFYPQYTLMQARDLPYRDIVLLLREAAKIEAARNMAQVHIAAAPHSKTGKAVQELSMHYEGIMNGTD